MSEPTAQRRVLPVLFLGVLMAALDIAIVAPALPALREAFGVDERAIAWVFNTFVLCNLAGLPVMAKLSDRFGRRLIYLANTALFAAGALVVASSTAFETMLVGRVLQGIGASGIFPVANAVVGDLFKPEERGRAVGIIGAVFGLAFMIGPILGGILLSVGSWSWLFYVPLPLAVLVFVLGLRVLPSEGQGVSAPLDVSGLFLLSLMLGLLAFGLNGIDAADLGASLLSWRVAPLLVGALILVPVFVRVERRAVDPVLRLDLLKSRQVVLASLFAVGAGLTEATFIFFSAFAVAAFAVPKATASYMLLPLVVAVAFGSPVAGRLIDRLGSRPVVMGGLFSLAAGLGVMGGLSAQSEGYFYVGSVLIGLGLSCLLGSSLSYILLNESRVTERAVAQGLITLFISIGQLSGGALIGAIVASAGAGTQGYQQSFWFIGIIVALLLAAALGLKGREAELAAARANDQQQGLAASPAATSTMVE